MLVRELNTKQACMLVFIVSSKVHIIVTIIDSDISSVILIFITVLIQ